MRQASVAPKLARHYFTTVRSRSVTSSMIGATLHFERLIIYCSLGQRTHQGTVQLSKKREKGHERHKRTQKQRNGRMTSQLKRTEEPTKDQDMDQLANRHHLFTISYETSVISPLKSHFKIYSCTISIYINNYNNFSQTIAVDRYIRLRCPFQNPLFC